ncbi:MAG TPA: hypothetical protein ENK85_04970 [Saprospiraceae bacterium]|nr:hypothetical protein [Saprospiraceae bacterium]
MSPIPLSKNHRYDIQTKAIIKKLHADSNCIDVGCFKGEILDLMLQAAPKGQHFGNYIKNIDSLSLDDFTRQYNQKENYYFVAHK